jgi:hypothetical protein
MNDLTPRQRFKVAFLTSCLEAGMSPTQTLGAARALTAAIELEKSALGPGEALGNVALGTLGLAAVAPPVIGYAGGYLAGKVGDEAVDTDVKTMQKQDLLSAYQRLRLVAEQNRRVKDYEAQRRRTGRVFA